MKNEILTKLSENVRITVTSKTQSYVRTMNTLKLNAKKLEKNVRKKKEIVARIIWIVETKAHAYQWNIILSAVLSAGNHWLTLWVISSRTNKLCIVLHDFFFLSWRIGLSIRYWICLFMNALWHLIKTTATKTAQSLKSEWKLRTIWRWIFLTFFFPTVLTFLNFIFLNSWE